MSTLRTNNVENLDNSVSIATKSIALKEEDYVSLGAYAGGLVFDNYNKTFTYNGTEYRPLSTLTLPYTTDGSGVIEIANFRSVGGEVLSSDLAEDADPTKGAALIGYKGSTVAAHLDNYPSVWEYMSSAQRADSLLDEPLLDHSTAFQAAVDNAIATGVKRIFVPFSQRQRYRLNSTVLIEASGFAVVGDSFPQYNLNGFQAQGSLIAQIGTGYIFGVGVTSLFDYGNDRTDLTSNQLVFEGISFFGSNKTTTNAVRYSQNNNGPHRGVLFRNCSGGEFTNVVLFDSPGLVVSAASVVVETCSFRSNINAVKANKEVFNFRFVGNQSEQGAHIDGFFDGGVTIDDNMLEGQQNPINIDALTAQVSIRNNYFELNTGEYLISANSSTADSSISIEPNYIVLPETTDLYKLSGGWRIYENYVNSQVGATADRKASITAHGLSVVQGSNVTGRFNLATTEVETRTKVRGYCNPSRLITPVPASAVLSQALGSVSLKTPFGHTRYGVQYTGLAASTIILPVSFTAGDAVTVCALVQTVPSSDIPVMRVLNQLNGIIGIECSQIASNANRAGWHVMFASGVVTGGGTEVRMQFDSGGVSTLSVAAVGAYVVPSADFESYNSTPRPYIEVFNPFDPTFKLSATMAYDPPSLAAGAGDSATISLPGALLGDSVVVSFNQNLDQVTLTGWVSSPGVVRFRFQNDSGVVKDLPSGIIKALVI